MKKMIVVLLSAFALLSGGDACFAQVSAARHGGVHSGRDRRPEGYSKDSWTVYYRGLKVEGASASSFVDLGDGYGKDNWKVFYCGEEVKGASASSFESLGKGRARILALRFIHIISGDNGRGSIHHAGTACLSVHQISCCLHS